jgi:hypothetical protein
VRQGLRRWTPGREAHFAASRLITAVRRSREVGLAYYHLDVKQATRADVQSAAAHARYVARLGKYQRRGDLVEAVHGNMPSWAKGSPVSFWTAADEYERANARLYTEIEFALPRELPTEARAPLVREFVDSLLGDRHVYTYALHEPHALDGQPNPHVHLMFSTRQLDGIARGPDVFFKRANSKNPEKGGTRKDESWNRDEMIPELRLAWERTCNRALERAGIEERVDSRSLRDQGIEREPERRLGPHLTQQLREDPELLSAYLGAREAQRAVDTLSKDIERRQAERDELFREAEAIRARARADAERQAREAAYATLLAAQEREWLQDQGRAQADRDAAEDERGSAEHAWLRWEREQERQAQRQHERETARRAREDAERLAREQAERRARDEETARRAAATQDTPAKAPEKPVEPHEAPPLPWTLLYVSDVREGLSKILTEAYGRESTFGSQITNTIERLQQERFAAISDKEGAKASAASTRASKASTDLYDLQVWGSRWNWAVRLAAGTIKFVWYGDRMKALEETEKRERALETAYRKEETLKWNAAKEYARSHESVRLLHEQREKTREEGQQVRDLDRLLKEIDQPGRAIALTAPTYDGIKEFAEQYKRDPSRTMNERSVIDKEREKVIKQKQQQKEREGFENSR